jgi:MinD-like ATPase involved in chromosome partitioning or flagellar assembly
VIPSEPVIPDENDEPTAAHDPEARANGTAASAVPHAASQAPAAEPAEAGVPAADARDEVQYDDYLTSGANPFSSVHPQGTGLFPRLLPREFPDDGDTPDDVPVMEQLPDPNALPGYPVMPGYQQAFPPVASAFPPAPEYPGDPYQAQRAPEAAPPLPGTASPWPDVRASARPQEAPPLAAPPPHAPPQQTQVPAAAPFPPPPLTSSAPPAPPAFGSPGARPAAPGRAPAAPEPTHRETADSLTTDVLLHGKRPPPGTGWRRTVYRASGGMIRIGESAVNLRRRDLVNRIRTPVAGGHHRVAVMSLKGGVGKTTTAVGLGATLASMRGDRVIAVDANPDRGTLSDKVRLETSATIRDLLNERAQVTRYADVRAYTSQASSRLEILASDRDPGVSVAFSADDYRSVARVLEHYYSICITDCGTGLLHSAMSGILELADHIVLVSSPSVDGARSASATLDWLEAHDYADLVRNGVVVLSTIRPKSKSTVDLDRLEQHFAARCRAVIRIPYDPHLEEGAEVELELLNSETADAYLSLAALVGDGFAQPRRPLARLTHTTRFA